MELSSLLESIICEYNCLLIRFFGFKELLKITVELLILQLQDSNLDLILKSGEGKLTFRYVKLKFEPDKLNSFLQNTKDATSFNFCHIIFRQGKHEVVKTIINQALWLIKVRSVEMVREY